MNPVGVSIARVLKPTSHPYEPVGILASSLRQRNPLAPLVIVERGTVSYGIHGSGSGNGSGTGTDVFLHLLVIELYV